MTNRKEVTHHQNEPNEPEGTNYAPDTQSPISDPTLQRKVPAKTEITITRKQLNAAARLFKDYGKAKPSWLRQKFYINQRRRKCLNAELMEAQLDRAYCGHGSNADEWDGLLHHLWHQINGELPCCK